MHGIALALALTLLSLIACQLTYGIDLIYPIGFIGCTLACLEVAICEKEKSL